MSGRFDALDDAQRTHLREAGLTAAAVARGVLWRDWLAHGRILAAFLAIWAIVIWVVPVLFHPGFVLVLGGLLALVAGRLLGGDEAAEGTEEYALALPPTRRQRYLTRLALGGGPVLLVAAGGAAAIALDLPQRIWGLAASSGLTAPFPPADPLWYALAVAAPLAAYAITFALAATARSPGAAEASWIGGGLLTAAVAALAWLGERILRGDVAPWLAPDGVLGAVPAWWPTAGALIAVAALAVLVGLSGYARKEGITRPAHTGGGSAMRLVLILFLILVLLAALMSFSLVQRSGDGGAAHPRIEQHGAPAASEAVSGGSRSEIPPRIEHPEPPATNEPAPATAPAERR